MEEEYLLDTNNVTMDTFSHMPNTKRENENVIFTSNKIDKSDELLYALKNLTIKNTIYYASNSATATDSQVNITRDPKTVTNTINSKEKVTDTRNGNLNKNY